MRWSALGLIALLGTGIAPALARGGGGGGGGGGFHGGGSFGGGGGGYHFSGAPSVAPERFAPAPAPERMAQPAYTPERAAPIAEPRPAEPRPAEQRPVAAYRAAPSEANLNRGYQGVHPLYGAGARSAWTRHNISAEQFRSGRYPGAWNGENRNGGGSWNRGDFNRQVNLENNFYNRNVEGWSPQWNNGGYWGNRPWGYGWYNWSQNSWGWWGGSSPGWGLAGLAAGAVITDLVDQAANQQSPVIDVPDSNYQLNYGSVDSVGSSGANFSYAVANPSGPTGATAPIKGAANCQEGLLDGQIPSTAAQAQLLNAACQVAYGPDPKGTPLPEGLAASLPSWLRDLLILALGGGIAVAGWQVAERRSGRQDQGEHKTHARVTSG